VPLLDPRDAVGGHQGIIEGFIRSIENKTEPETSGSDNIKSLAMVFAAVESAKMAQPVSIVV
jgi:predicted dehydrogenase